MATVSSNGCAATTRPIAGIAAATNGTRAAAANYGNSEYP
jgi:hypothetical protein